MFATTAATVTTSASLLGGYAAYQGATAANKAAIANANSVGQESLLVQQQGIQAQAKKSQEIGQVEGAQEAAYASSGIDTGSGTAATVKKQTLDLGKADIMTIQSNTLNQMNALKTQQQGYINSMQNPFLAAGSTVLTDLAMGGVFKGVVPGGNGTADMLKKAKMIGGGAINPSFALTS